MPQKWLLKEWLSLFPPLYNEDPNTTDLKDSVI